MLAEEGGPSTIAAEWCEQFESVASGTCGKRKVKKIHQPVYLYDRTERYNT